MTIENKSFFSDVRYDVRKCAVRYVCHDDVLNYVVQGYHVTITEWFKLMSLRIRIQIYLTFNFLIFCRFEFSPVWKLGAP